VSAPRDVELGLLFYLSQVFQNVSEILAANDLPDIRVMALALNHSDTPLVDVTAPMLPWSRASSTVGGD
jgi:hypothetical protein